LNSEYREIEIYWSRSPLWWPTDVFKIIQTILIQGQCICRWRWTPRNGSVLF